MFVRDKDDLHCTITVPIADAALGGEVTVESILGDPVTITIPQGTQPGHVIKVRGRVCRI